jgi:hypothetical protein
MTEEDLNAAFARTAKKKAAQAAAHKRWRESEKGRAYMKKKKRKANDPTSQGS